MISNLVGSYPEYSMGYDEYNRGYQVKPQIPYNALLLSPNVKLHWIKRFYIVFDIWYLR